MWYHIDGLWKRMVSKKMVKEKLNEKLLVGEVRKFTHIGVNESQVKGIKIPEEKKVCISQHTSYNILNFCYLW